MATKQQPGPDLTLDAGNDALARGDWASARSIFDVLVTGDPSAAALEGQSWAAWWQDDGETVFTARERAYQIFRDAGDMRGAARMAIWLGNDYIDFRGEMAIANGWLQLAARLLADLPTSDEHGWLAMLQADLYLLFEQDLAAAKRKAQEAIAIALQVRNNDVAVMGRTIEGLALVIEGQISRGLSQLDGAAVEVLGGDIKEFFAVSFVLCHLLYACEFARDFDRASQWCQRTKDYADRMGFTFAQGTCRAHYASVLLWRGLWADAERELSEAGRYLGQSRPPYESEARVRLAELRRRQGRKEEAASLFTDVEWHPLAALGLAELSLDAGNLRDAEEYVQRVLRMIPESSVAQRATVLDVWIRVSAAAGDLETARRSLLEFEGIAEVIGTLPLRAASRSLAGVAALAEGRANEARGHFEDAVALYERCRAPYEAACARVRLAGLLDRAGRTERAHHEATIALAALRDLGAASDAERAEALLADDSGAQPAKASVLTERQIQILQSVAQGMSDREIAAALVMSEHTVHRHIANILQRLGEPSRAAAVAHASRLGLL